MDLFRKSAGYRYLDAFVLANVVELGTGHFCERFLTLRNDPGCRTYAQMTHAARSGCRNFAEGSERLMTSYATATELLDVARAGSGRPHGQVTCCEVSYMAQGLTAGKATSGLRDKDFVTQGRNAEMVEECDRYVVL